MQIRKIVGLSILILFAMLQVSACFVAAYHTEGYVSVFYFTLAIVSCFFGLALNFILFIIAIDIFGALFASMAANFAKKEPEDIEIVE